MNIISNGSKFSGEPVDSFSKLLEVVENYKLRPDFMRYGGFFFKSGAVEYTAFGNFEKISHVFRITGTLEELLPLTKTLKQNRRKYGIR